MESKIEFETQRLRVRHWNRRYAELLESHCNTPEVLHHLDGRKLTGDEHEDLTKWLASQQDDSGITFWVVETKDKDEFLGFCGLVKVDEPDSPVLGATEIGWRFRTDRQGNGYALEAATACMHYAFDENGTGDGFANVCEGLRVVSRTTVANERSWRLMLKLGMKHEPRLDYLPAGATFPQITHVMTYTDWKARKRSLPDTRLKQS